MRSLVLAFLMFIIAAPCTAQVRVKGYVRKDGTYVAPHYRSSPNNSRLDNYSTRGNYNPYTGKRGTVNPYPQPGTSYSPPNIYAPAPAQLPGAYYRPPATYWQQRVDVDRAQARAELQMALVDEVNSGTRSLKSLSEDEYAVYQQLSTAPAQMQQPWAEEQAGDGGDDY